MFTSYFWSITVIIVGWWRQISILNIEFNNIYMFISNHDLTPKIIIIT